MTNKKHRGQVIKKTIEKLGLKIKEVARQADISRGTLYNYFKESDLDDSIMLKMGRVLRHDFSIHFPELIPLKDEYEEDSTDYVPATTKELADIQKKYYNVLEKYNALLIFLVKLSVDYDLEPLKKKLVDFYVLNLEDE